MQTVEKADVMHRKLSESSSAKGWAFWTPPCTYFLNALILTMNYTTVHLVLLSLARNGRQGQLNDYWAVSRCGGFYRVLQKDIARDRKGENGKGERAENHAPPRGVMWGWQKLSSISAGSQKSSLRTRRTTDSEQSRSECIKSNASLRNTTRIALSAVTNSLGNRLIT